MTCIQKVASSFRGLSGVQSRWWLSISILIVMETRNDLVYVKLRSLLKETNSTPFVKVAKLFWRNDSQTTVVYPFVLATEEKKVC